MTITVGRSRLPCECSPSISTNNVLRMRSIDLCRVRSRVIRSFLIPLDDAPPLPSLPLPSSSLVVVVVVLAPSKISMLSSKIIQGAIVLAAQNMSAMPFSASPTTFCTRSAQGIDSTLQCLLQAYASQYANAVLPLSLGPYSMIPGYRYQVSWMKRDGQVDRWIWIYTLLYHNPIGVTVMNINDAADNTIDNTVVHPSQHRMMSVLHLPLHLLLRLPPLVLLFIDGELIHRWQQSSSEMEGIAVLSIVSRWLFQ